MNQKIQLQNRPDTGKSIEAFLKPDRQLDSLLEKMETFSHDLDELKTRLSLCELHRCWHLD